MSYCYVFIVLLFLGYLEDQQCTEAAKQFLESSPHLLECRTVASHGKRFSTKVNGLTLTDIIEKFCAISAISELCYLSCLLSSLLIDKALIKQLQQMQRD